MVYFGPRKYRPSNRGLNRREKIRVIAPILLLVVLSLIVFSSQFGDEEKPVQIAPDVIPSQQSDEISGATGGERFPTSGVDVPEPVAITPIDTALPDPAPFVENASVLAMVRDSEAVNPGVPERAGLFYLLHRWRSGVEVPDIEEAPRVSEIATQSKSLRGKRCRMVLTLIENPIPRTIEENRSGLKRIWEVFGTDSDGSLHRVDFIRKPKNLPIRSDVVMEGDFLRLYRYQRVNGQGAMVPQWVANTLEPYQSPFVGKGDQYFLLWIVGILAIVTLLLLLMIQNRGPRQSLRRRRKS